MQPTVMIGSAMTIDSLPSPQVLIDLPRLERNIARMQDAVGSRGLRLRPHAKTHKSPDVASMQLKAGAVGICCAKVGEAEVFAAAGVPDIRLPYPVQPTNAPRLLALMDRARMSIIVDDVEVARAWSDTMVQAGRTLDVLVKVDVGFHRCGVNPESPGALAAVREVSRMKGLSLRGLLSHAGHGYHAQSAKELEAIARSEAGILAGLADAARQDGIALAEVSVGATPTARYSVQQKGLTEMRPGNYVYFDRTQVALEAAALDDCALTVYATVVSRPAPDRVILDCGSKTLAADTCRGFTPQPGYGAILVGDGERTVDATLLIERLSEEHATVRVVSGSANLKTGDRVTVLPNHSCVVSNLVDAVHLVEGRRVIDTLSVAARGKIA